MPSELLRLHCVTHDDNATVRARNRTLNQNEAALWIALHYFKIESGDLLVTHVASHSETFEYTTGE